MKKLTDEEIQKIVEEQQFDKSIGEADEDLRAYKLLFEVLKEEPAGGLPLQFADRVARKALIRAEARKSRRYLLLQLLSIGIALPLSIVLIFIYQPVMGQQLGSYLYENRWIIAFSVLMFMLIQTLDYSLLRGRKGINNT